MHKIFLTRPLELLFLSFNARKCVILTIFVIPKSRDWDAANPGIQDWQKRPGSWDTGIPRLQSLPMTINNFSSRFAAWCAYLTLDGRRPITRHNLESDAASHISLVTQNSQWLHSNKNQE